MIGPRNIHPDELGEAEGMDVQDALRVGNRLVEAMDEVPMPTEQDFVDNVMAALADEPTPGMTGFLVPLRRRGVLGGFRQSFRQAWASVGAGRPKLGRSAALAYVLVVVVAGVSLTGAAALGTAGALGLFNATPTESPTLPPPPAPTDAPPTEAPATVAPSPSENAPEPTVAPMPSPTETDDETDGPDDNSGPGGGDDDDSSGPGGNSGRGSSGSGSDGSDGSGSAVSGPGSDNSGPG